MSIVFHEKTREFHLYNDKISYIFQVLRNGQLGQLYTGARLRDREDFSHLAELGFVVDSDVTVVSEIAGNLILQVKNSRIALDKTMANRILV